MSEPAANPPPALPQSSGGGCCGMGCGMLFALFLLFGLAFAGGAYWTLRHYTREYTSAQPMEMPADVTSETTAPIAPNTSSTGASQTTPIPARNLETQWKAFEKAADRNQKARIELSAAQINTLIQNSKNARGKAYVWIENDAVRVQVSIPIRKVPMMGGRYLNGEMTVRSSPEGDLSKARITDLKLAGKSVPESVLDQRFFGGSSMREAILTWVNKRKIETFRVENNRVIAETRGE